MSQTVDMFRNQIRKSVPSEDTAVILVFKSCAILDSFFNPSISPMTSVCHWSSVLFSEYQAHSASEVSRTHLFLLAPPIILLQVPIPSCWIPAIVASSAPSPTPPPPAPMHTRSRNRNVTQSCPTLCDPMDCSRPGSCPWDFPGKSPGVGCHFLLQGIFPTQGSNSGLPNCRQTWADSKPTYV